MIVGTADIDELAFNAPTLDRYRTEPVELGGVVCFQLTAEMPNTAREAVLPPGLHPTVPPALSLQAYEVGSSPWGPFSMVTSRVVCRSGVRARGFTTAAVASTPEAAAGLESWFGFPARVGEIAFRHHYSGLDLEVTGPGSASEPTLIVHALDPEPMGLDDVQYTGNLNLAKTPNGLRLVQVEANHVASRVERLTSRILRFEPTAWGNELLDPYFVVSSSVATETVGFPPVRFVCRPDELAFTGTEQVATAGGQVTDET